MHNGLPYQEVRVLTIHIAVDASRDQAEVCDEITALLSENGLNNDDTTLVDWCYAFPQGKEVDQDAPLSSFPVTVLNDEPQEGDAFINLGLL